MFRTVSRDSVNVSVVKHAKASFRSSYRGNLLGKPKLLMSISRAVEDVEATATDNVGPNVVHLHVSVPLSVNFGEHLRLVGSCPELGEWDVNSAPQFQWSSGDVWQLDVDVGLSTKTEFKLVHVLGTGECIWEYTNNRTLDVSSIDAMKDGRVLLKWCDESDDAMTVYSEKMSTVASWDEEDTPTLRNGFDDEESFDTFTDNTRNEIPITTEEPIEMIEENSGAEKLIENEDVMENEEVQTDAAESILTETVEDEKSGSNKEALKKAATTAGMVAAGVAGAALLGGLAVDVADTAVLGAFAVAAGSAAFGPKSVKRKKDDSPQETDSQPPAAADDEEDKAITEPGTIIAAGLLSAFEQGSKVVNGATPGETAQDLSKDDNVEME